jgi:hypothetical protein
MITAQNANDFMNEPSFDAACGDNEGENTLLLESLSEKLILGKQNAQKVRLLKAQLHASTQLQENTSQQLAQAKLTIEKIQTQANHSKAAQKRVEEKFEVQRALHAQALLDLRGKLAHSKEQIQQLQEEIKVRFPCRISFPE